MEIKFYHWFPGLITVCVVSAIAIEHPFPIGYSMGTLGALHGGSGMGARQSWEPAAWLGDSGIGCSMACVNYYGEMGSGFATDMWEGAIGASARHGNIMGKTAYTTFKIADLYVEHRGFVSLGFAFLRIFTVSIDATGSYAAPLQIPDEYETYALLGSTMRVEWRMVWMSVQISNLHMIKASVDGVVPAPAVVCGLQTKENSFGAQGLALSADLTDDPGIRIFLAEEYWFHPVVGIQLACATNPTLISFGIVVRPKALGAALSFVNHAQLGWSKGIDVDYFNDK